MKHKPTTRKLSNCLIPIAAALGGIALTATSVYAEGTLNDTIRSGLTPEPAPEVTIFTAKKVLTMERTNPEAEAVAVRDKRIVAVGSLAEVKAALGDTKFAMNETFAGKLMLPGFIDQHLHPILGALTLSTEVIAPEEENGVRVQKLTEIPALLRSVHAKESPYRKHRCPKVANF